MHHRPVVLTVYYAFMRAHDGCAAARDNAFRHSPRVCVLGLCTLSVRAEFHVGCWRRSTLRYEAAICLPGPPVMV